MCFDAAYRHRADTGVTGLVDGQIAGELGHDLAEGPPSVDLRRRGRLVDDPGTGAWDEFAAVYRVHVFTHPHHTVRMVPDDIVVDQMAGYYEGIGIGGARGSQGGGADVLEFLALYPSHPPASFRSGPYDVLTAPRAPPSTVLLVSSGQRRSGGEGCKELHR